MDRPEMTTEEQMSAMDLLEEVIELMDEAGVTTRDQAVRRLADLEAALGDDPVADATAPG